MGSPTNTETATAPRRDYQPADDDAATVEDTARKLGLSRSTVYLALNRDPSKRRGIPFLPSLKVGKRRLIRAEARRAWLRELEERQTASAKSA